MDKVPQADNLLKIKAHNTVFPHPKAENILKTSPVTRKPDKAENGMQIVRTMGRQDVAIGGLIPPAALVASSMKWPMRLRLRSKFSG